MDKRSTVEKPVVEGIDLDKMTRCSHWHGPTDIIAIQFACCKRWFACYDCHEAVTRHSAKVWRQEDFSNAAILCGSCQNTLTITEYFSSQNTCSHCSAAFNPQCSKHYHLYFDIKI